ncbi:FRG domain-containing protein [Terribacillus saccharophilus]|uniref:FRG domain-containing protein n=1 Tax=Terribacillus saccharophilus TaxID=361277 RepID=A0A268AB72_9BACI|nr:FRG domain-containing protein [Terribacillus saccharophilus]PAD21309.1 hypothetical protein CHH64_09405 [Terribacillus saccharophilus]
MVHYSYYDENLSIPEEIFTEFKCHTHGFEENLDRQLILVFNKELHGIICTVSTVEDMFILKSISKVSKVSVKNTKSLQEGINKFKEVEIEEKRIYIQNLIDFMVITMSANSSSNLYRGQANALWDLEPSIIRGKAIPDKEAVIYQEIQQANHLEFIDEDFKNNACNMQHYGVPTRLLDWTENSLHALYFACVSQDNISEDGKVYIINSPDIININADESSIINYFLRYKYIKDKDSKKIITNHFKKIAFNNKRYTFFKTKYYNNRIKSQQGCFSIYYDQSEEEAIEVRNLLYKELKETLDKRFRDLINDQRYRTSLDEIFLLLKSKKIDSYAVNKILKDISERFSTDLPIEVDFVTYLTSWLKKIINVVVKPHKMEDIIKYEDQLQVIIQSQVKNRIIEELNAIGINSRTVYPDLQGLVNYLKERY